ncbi:vacuolar protein sorting protein vps66 [Moniliophthora roreri MCA 2997]|uniref:Vacuolar protein sorting protein vps66 n=1 Tax=Moniliophthora roreri (strain MCA 2997) TaxID=1381753 RepID=V2XYU0_MONRO|nr:vacuolar protein sorting protein vps66 [Moniliophthora roreri MCA 2997]
MEKYSAYRDPGTGIQPFLTPVPPPKPGSDFLYLVWAPIGYVIGAIRTVLVLGLTLVYVLLVHGVLSVFCVLPPAHRFATRIVTALLCRVVLFLAGFVWIPVEIISRKRGRGNTVSQQWTPAAGDIIVSNWTSWVELLWLAFRFNPIFVMPIPESSVPNAPSTPSTPITHTPGRRMGTGSANIASNARTVAPQIPIVGFYPVSLLTAIRNTALVPPFPSLKNHRPQSLDDIRKNADRPLVVFPECTTSNGRGLLRFADVFKRSAPVTGHNIFLMSVRYDPPTTFSLTASHSIPPTALNPLHHLFSLTFSITPSPISIRLLSPSESPSSPLFMASEVIPGAQDSLTEACSVLIAQTGKLKRMSLGWEDKSKFLDFYRGKRSS